MKEKFLVVCILLVLSLSVLGYSFDKKDNVCYCDSANDCNTAIANSKCNVIKLTKDISGPITFNSVSNKIFDGKGHIIYDGEYEYTMLILSAKNIKITNTILKGSNYGILFYKGRTNTDITIENCNISGKIAGFRFSGTNSNVLIENCNISSKYLEIWFDYYSTNSKITIKKVTYRNQKQVFILKEKVVI